MPDWPISRRALIATLGAAALPKHARAQETSARPPQIDVPTASPRTLIEGLRDLYWAPESRGALLVLLPTPVETQRAFPAPKAPITRGRSGYRLNELAAAFDRMVLPFGSITAAAPSTMIALGVPPGLRPQDLPIGNYTDLARELYATLTPAQWSKLGGASGLAGTDLSGAQRGLFLGLFPDPIVLRPVRSDNETNLEPPGTLRFSGNQRLNLRLRMTRRVNISFMPEGTNGEASVTFGEGPRPDAPQYMIASLPSDFNLNRVVAPQIPNRPRLSDLDTRNLSATIPLTGGANVDGVEGVLTIGELLRRCATATGLELYADARCETLLVLVRGESARAGDILDALARSVTGMFRRVSDGRDTAYVLTDERVGLGPRLAAIAALREGMQKLAAERRLARDEKYRGSSFDPESVIGFTDVSGYSAELLRQIVRSGRTPRRPDTPVGFAVGELPPPLQNRVRDLLQKHPTGIAFENGQATQKPLRADRVSLGAPVETVLVAPDGATAAMTRSVSPSFPDPQPDIPTEPPFAWPDAWKQRVILLDGTDTVSLPQLLSAAKKAGATLALIDVPNHESSAAVLNAAVAAGKTVDLPVGASIDPLAVPRNVLPTAVSATDPMRDRNARGETSDIVAARLAENHRQNRFAPDGGPIDRVRLAPAVGAPERIETFAALARVSGLAMVAVRGTFAPGYAGPDSLTLINSGMDNQLGFTPANRLAFLRAAHIDPIDLPPGRFFDSNLDLPAFSNRSLIRSGASGPQSGSSPDPLRAWQTQRAQEMATLRAALFARLQRESSTPPLWLDSPETLVAGALAPVWWRWDKSGLQPPPSSNADSYQIATARRFASHIWAVVAPAEENREKPDGLVSRLSSMRREAQLAGTNWDGIVFDLTRIDSAHALAQLAALPR